MCKSTVKIFTRRSLRRRKGCSSRSKRLIWSHRSNQWWLILCTTNHLIQSTKSPKTPFTSSTPARSVWTLLQPWINNQATCNSNRLNSNNSREFLRRALKAWIRWEIPCKSQLHTLVMALIYIWAEALLCCNSQLRVICIWSAMTLTKWISKKTPRTIFCVHNSFRTLEWAYIIVEVRILSSWTRSRIKTHSILPEI